MSLIDLNDAGRASHRLAVTMCGSFRRDPAGLAQTLEALRARFHVLSPTSLDFIDPAAGFVRLATELTESEATIEERHLAAMSAADLVWLHAPEGYVGTSTALELGHAFGLGIPVFAATAPIDPVLAMAVTVVRGPDQIDLESITSAGKPGHGVDRLQHYYKRTADRRGWASESPRDTLLLLTEELGELARAIRVDAGLSRQSEGDVGEVGLELADVQLYLVHLANALGLNLSDAVTAKERINAERFDRTRGVA